MEVGCGEGQLLQAIKADGDPSWRVVGVDISEDACEALRRTGLEMRCAQFEDLDWPDGTVDLVIMNQVIEHLADPACVRGQGGGAAPARRAAADRDAVGGIVGPRLGGRRTGGVAGTAHGTGRSTRASP